MRGENHTNEQMTTRLAGLRKDGRVWVFGKVSVIVSWELDTLTAARQRKLAAVPPPKLCLEAIIIIIIVVVLLSISPSIQLDTYRCFQDLLYQIADAHNIFQAVYTSECGHLHNACKLTLHVWF